MNKTDAQNPAVIKLTAESQYWFDRCQQLQDALADVHERRDDLQQRFDDMNKEQQDMRERLSLISELHRVSDKIGYRASMNPANVTQYGLNEMIKDAKDFSEAVLVSDVSGAVGFQRPGKNATRADWQKYADALENAVRQVRAKYNRNGKR